MLIVPLVVEFLLEFRIAKMRWQVGVLKPTVDAAPHLFDGQRSRVLLVIETPADTTAQKEAQRRDIVVTMNATPAANLEVIHSQFFFADAQFRFDAPAAESDAEQPA